jgi:hypothetical protein
MYCGILPRNGTWRIDVTTFDDRRGMTRICEMWDISPAYGPRLLLSDTLKDFGSVVIKRAPIRTSQESFGYGVGLSESQPVVYPWAGHIRTPAFLSPVRENGQGSKLTWTERC